MALLANINRDKKKRPRPFTPDDFNPLRKRVFKKVGSIMGTIVSQFMPPAKQGAWAAIKAAKARAQESGDWSEFKRLAAEANRGHS